MSYRIIFHPRAEKEFNEAYQWYEDRLSGLGDHFISVVEEKLDLISIKPLHYQKRKDEFREAKVKTFPLCDCV